MNESPGNALTPRTCRAKPMTARLSTDLDLDSLRRVELLGVIEEELGTFIDDDVLEPDATVGDLVALVETARAAKRGAPACTPRPS